MVDFKYLWQNALLQRLRCGAQYFCPYIVCQFSVVWQKKKKNRNIFKLFCTKVFIHLYLFIR